MKGYIKIQDWMINDYDLRGNELIIFATIYSYSGSGEMYRGSLSYIAKGLKLSRDTVVRSIKSLITKKLIEKQYHKTGNLYSSKVRLGWYENRTRGGTKIVPQVVAKSDTITYTTNNKLEKNQIKNTNHQDNDEYECPLPVTEEEKRNAMRSI
jgi:hypothetical protein